MMSIIRKCKGYRVQNLWLSFDPMYSESASFRWNASGERILFFVVLSGYEDLMGAACWCHRTLRTNLVMPALDSRSG